MKGLIYALSLLLIFAQIDDCWAINATPTSVPLTDDEDEYLPPQQRPEENLSTSRRGPMFVKFEPDTAVFDRISNARAIASDVPPKSLLAGLYVLMVLLI
jgi:hypothetical protein